MRIYEHLLRTNPQALIDLDDYQVRYYGRHIERHREEPVTLVKYDPRLELGEVEQEMRRPPHSRAELEAD